MGDNKISEAVEAIAARFRSGNSVPVERASVPRNEWESLIAAFAHLQGEAVPVAWIDLTKLSRSKMVCASAYQIEPSQVPVFSHPQPAELSEVSGDDGFPMVMVSQEFKHQAEYDAEELSAVANLLRNNSIGLSGSCSEMVAKLLVLAATGTQQAGDFPWENFPAYLIDKCEGGTISEEGIQRAVADMAKDSRYATVQQVGENPTLDPGLVKWLSERDLLPDAHNGEIDMDSVIEALNEHERELTKPMQVGGVQGEALVDTARRNIRQFISKASFSSSVDKQAALSCVDVLEAALASRQPVGHVPDGVWEALQRIIENSALHGPASNEDAVLVARYRRDLLATPPAQGIDLAQLPSRDAVVFWRRFGKQHEADHLLALIDGRDAGTGVKP